MTIIELAIALPIILIATSMIASALFASSRQRTVNRENAVAADAVRTAFEEMRNEDFDELFALYNAEAFDDPVGPGTAPGNRFAIDELVPLPGQEFVGEVILPVINTGGAIDTNWELREDAVFDRLGTPRDLNGDGAIDDLNHAKDYRVVPVEIVARWVGTAGPREFRMQTLLADWNPQP